MSGRDKVSFTLEKRSWGLPALNDKIVLVTPILNADGKSSVAPKSWLSMLAFEPALPVLGCNLARPSLNGLLFRFPGFTRLQ